MFGIGECLSHIIIKESRYSDGQKKCFFESFTCDMGYRMR